MMNRNNRDRQTLQQEYDHLMLRIAMCEMQDEDMNQILSDAAVSKEDARLEADFFSKTEPKAFELFHDSITKQHRVHMVKRVLPKALRLASFVLLFLYISVTVAIAVSPAIRVRVMELFFREQEEYTEVEFRENPEKAFDVPADWTGDYFLAYIPDGFEMTYLFTDDYGSNDITYTKADQRISFTIYDETFISNVDTENADTQQILVNGSPATMVTKGHRIQIIWAQRTNYFILLTINLDRDVTMQIAENILRIN